MVELTKEMKTFSDANIRDKDLVNAYKYVDKTRTQYLIHLQTYKKRSLWEYYINLHSAAYLARQIELGHTNA